MSGETRTLEGKTVLVDMDSLLGKRASGETDRFAPLSAEVCREDAERVIGSLTPKPFDKYEYRKSLGRGGMKVVIQVRDRDTMRDVAMAILPDSGNRPKEDILRFIEEARVAAGLEHPNIVPIHDIGVDRSGSPYFTMKLLRGQTFSDVLHHLAAGEPDYVKEYSLDRLLRIFLKVCNGIAFAHSKGVLHLDLKPANIQIGDFGEVQVMDWGLSRILGIGAEAGHAAGASSGPGSGFDGVTKGTPGYMAPEQAAGLNSMSDCRTDIYALGAILYAILTLKNPVDGKQELEKQLKDTLNGNIIPPQLRTPERVIPAAVEAVAMKAMSVRPDERYATVRELQNEVYAFLDGFATRAERASFFRKTVLFLHRNLLRVAVTVLLAALFGGTALFLFREKRSQESGWFPGVAADFISSASAETPWSCRNLTMLTETAPWKRTPGGLVMKSGEWLWFRDTRLKDDLRVDMTFVPDRETAFVLAVNSMPEHLRYTWHAPRGYILRLSASSGVCMLSRNVQEDNPETIATAAAEFHPGKNNKLSFERNDGLFTVHLNGKKILETSDLFPLRTKSGRTGIFAISGHTLLKEVKGYALALPVKSSPLVAGDALVENAHYGEAVEKYLAIADAYAASNKAISEEALVKAYFIIVSKLMNSSRPERYLAAVKDRILSTFSQSKYRSKILELDALQFWMEKKYSRALDIAENLYEQNPATEIIQKLLQLPHQPLTKEDAERLIRNAARAKDLRHLNLSRLGLESIRGLAGCNLLYLDCSGNRLKDLSGTEDMPLEYLDCSYNMISSLKPLSGASLKELYCFCNRITSLEGVNVNGLQLLFAARNRIGDLNALQDAHSLTSLDIRDNAISSLEGLRKLNLTSLVAGENPIQDLSPLKRMGLQELYIDGTKVTDLEPITESPLIILGLYKCKNLTDISPLLKIPTLQRLSLPDHAENVELLEQHPGLLYITNTEMSPGPRSGRRVFFHKYRTGQQQP